MEVRIGTNVEDGVVKESENWGAVRRRMDSSDNNGRSFDDSFGDFILVLLVVVVVSFIVLVIVPILPIKLKTNT